MKNELIILETFSNNSELFIAIMIRVTNDCGNLLQENFFCFFTLYFNIKR